LTNGLPFGLGLSKTSAGTLLCPVSGSMSEPTD
jgi:hypothetical protein